MIESIFENLFKPLPQDDVRARIKDALIKDNPESTTIQIDAALALRAMLYDLGLDPIEPMWLENERKNTLWLYPHHPINGDVDINFDILSDGTINVLPNMDDDAAPLFQTESVDSVEAWVRKQQESND